MLAYSYGLGITGEFELFHSESGGGAGAWAKVPNLVRSVVREYIRDVLASFQPTIKDDGTILGRMDTLSSQLLSVEKLLVDPSASSYAVVEVLIQLIVMVPQMPYSEAYFHRTLLELCRFSPSKVAPAISSATGALFHEIPRMEFVSRKQFAAWFASHLKDTEFNWPFWQHWAAFAEENEPMDSPQKIFISSALANLVRLSYLDRIKRDLPEPLHSLLPPESIVSCPFSRNPLDEGSLDNIAVKLSEKAVEKIDEESMHLWLTTVLSPEIFESEEFSPSEWICGALTYAILRAGAPSPTHLHQSLDRYLSLLMSFVAEENREEACRLNILRIVMKSWISNPQVVNGVVKLLLINKVLLPCDIVANNFEGESREKWARNSLYWDLLETAITVSIETANTSYQLLERALSDDEMGDEDYAVDTKNLEDNFDSNMKMLSRLSYNILKRFGEIMAEEISLGPTHSEAWWTSTASQFKASVRMLFSVSFCLEFEKMKAFLDRSKEGLQVGLACQEKEVREIFICAEIALVELGKMMKVTNSG